MSYPKANLGAIVLPVPDGSESWSEYKARTGVDLHEIFEVRVSAVAFRRDFTKALYYFDNLGYFDPYNQVVPIQKIYQAGADGKSLALVIVGYDSDGVETGDYGFVFNPDYTISEI